MTRVVSSRSDAGALERARRASVSTNVLADPTDPVELVDALGDADLVVLAGYVKRVPPAAVARFRLRMINIHPALLPAFGGAGMYGRRVQEQVLASGVAFSGATVHYVDEEYDHGPIIAQWPVPIRPDDTPDTLAARVLEVEHRLLPLVVTKLARLGVPQFMSLDLVDYQAQLDRALAWLSLESLHTFLWGDGDVFEARHAHQARRGTSRLGNELALGVVHINFRILAGL